MSNLNELTATYLKLKDSIKELKKALHETYMADTEYAGFYEEVKVAKEVLNNRRDQLADPRADKIKALQADLKELKAQILAGVTVTVVDKETNQQLSLPF